MCLSPPEWLNQYVQQAEFATRKSMIPDAVRPVEFNIMEDHAKSAVMEVMIGRASAD